MPSSGSGTGTPISIPIPPPAAPGDALVRPLQWTLLSPDRYAKIMGISPAHFWGASAENLSPQRFPGQTCSSIYKRYSWQDSDKVSLSDIVTEIYNAESEIAKALGYWSAPMWINEERHQYPRPAFPEYYGNGVNVRGMAKAIPANWGKIIETGRRAVSLIQAATVAGGTLVYSDEDGDGLYETALISVPTSITNIMELKVYHYGYSGVMEYEIREPRHKYISGGSAYFIFDSWLLIDPALYEQFPTEEDVPTIDISVTTNFVSAVDVYREYIDNSQPSVEFSWESAYIGCASCNGAGCEVCGYVSQNGCMRINNYDEGIIVPIPADYDSTAGTWDYADWSADREPDSFAIWYRAGVRSQEFLSGRSHLEMPLDLARTIAYLATARLERPLCGCRNVEALAEFLRSDTVRAGAGQGMFFTTVNVVNNPFGTRVGEVMAWKAITKLTDRRSSAALI